MQTIEATASRLYDAGHYPVLGRNTEDDGRKRWAPIPVKLRKELAIQLVHQLLDGDRKAQALFFIRSRRYTPAQLENFIKSMERGLAARASQEGRACAEHP